MSGVDIRKIKIGDDVVVRVTVVDLVAEGVIVRVPAVQNDAVWFPVERIATHHPAPRPLKIGDRVRFKNRSPSPENNQFQVIGLDGEDVWLKADHFGRFNALASLVEVVDD